jgi:putative endonuclease
MARKDTLGRTGEQLAVEHLARAGFAILDRNWRCPLGEIDIVAREGDTTVVVEVKTRSGTGFGHPLESVTPRKLARLRRLAGAWCEAHPVPSATSSNVTRPRTLRIDVIGVIASHRSIEIEHVRQVC